MQLNWKKIALIGGFIAVVFIIGYLLYALFLRPAQPSQPATNTNISPVTGLPTAGTNVNIPTAGTPGDLPFGAGGTATVPGPPPTVSTGPAVSDVASGGLTRSTAVTSSQVIGTAVARDGSGVIFYEPSSGQFFKTDSRGSANKLTDEIFFEVEKVTWSPNQTQAVLEYPDGSNILYDFSNKRQITIPTHWKDFSFSPTGSQIVFKSIGTSQDNRWLAVSNTDGSRAIKIEHLGDKDATVYPDWSPNSQIIASYSEPSGADAQNLYFIGLNDENFKLIRIDGWNFQGKWSTSGDKLLYSTYSSQTSYKPALTIVSAQGDLIGENKKNLDLQTWAEKCTFADNTTLYCAVPQDLREGAGIFNELDNSPTDLYRIDLKTGFKSKIAIPEESHNMSSLMVSPDSSTLFYTNKFNGLLYQLRLR